MALLHLTWWEALVASEGIPCSGTWARPGPGWLCGCPLHRTFSSHEMPQSPHRPKWPFQEKLNPVQAHRPPSPWPWVSWAQGSRTPCRTFPPHGPAGSWLLSSQVASVLAASWAVPSGPCLEAQPAALTTSEILRTSGWIAASTFTPNAGPESSIPPQSRGAA